MIWKVLGIEQTKDEELIKSAYRTKLREVNPEDDEEGFKELRRAYEEALEYVTSEESGLHNTEGEQDGFTMPKNEVDLWVDRIDAIYQDAKTRKDEEKWKAVLHDPLCEDLDTELEAAEKLLVYFMSHSFMPQPIWQLVDKRFQYVDNFNQWKEKFPENFLSYVQWQIEHANFIDFELFYGKTDDHVDDYIGTLYEEKRALEEKDMKAVERLINELKRFDIKHPFTDLEKARYLLKKQELGEGDYAKEALEIMEELDFEYSENPYIERIYAEALTENGKYEKAKTIFDALLEKDADNFGALLGKAKCKFLEGNAEEAKEDVEDILEDRVQNTESLALLDKINDKLMKDYHEILLEREDREITFKLGWCFYQCKEFKKGIELLDAIEEGDDYDYVNLRCRLYLANEDYDKAFPYTKKWLRLIEECEDDGSHEMSKRKNRLSLAHFSLGVTMWELAYQKKKEKKIEEYKEMSQEAEIYIQKSVEEEHNTLVKLSYMEQLARFYIEEKRYEDSISVCNAIIEVDDGFFPAFVHRQNANYKLRNAKEVIDDYFICKDIYAGYSAPYVLAAKVFLAFEQYDDVESVLADAEEASLESDGLELIKIKIMHYKEFSKENVNKALDALLKLRKKVIEEKGGKNIDIEDPVDVERELAILYWDQDKVDKALEVVALYLEKEPESEEMLCLKIDILNREKKYEEALAVCKDLIALDTKNLYNRMKIGNCYERMDQDYKAIECYSMILEEEKEYVPAIRRLMYVYSFLSNRERDLDKCRKGIEYATKLIELTGNAEGYVERGNLYIDLYDLERAVEDCKEAIELDPEAFYAYNNLGCALLKLRRIEEAIVPLKQAIDMDPERDDLPYLNLAECYALQEKFDKAINVYKEALRIHPENVNLNEEIVKLYVRKKDYPVAVGLYKKRLAEVEKDVKKKVLNVFNREATAQDIQILSLNCKIADVYLESGNLMKAEKHYNIVVNHCKKLKGIRALAKLEDAAEFFRDIDRLDKAEKVIVFALSAAKPEERDTTDYAHLCFTAANIYVQLGKFEEVKKCADIFLKDLFDKAGGEEKLLSAKRYRPINLYLIGIIKICCGELEAGKRYIEQIKECKLCVHCEKCDCHEYYFGMGLVAELEGKTAGARAFYERAIQIKKGFYPAAERRLRNLK